MTAPAPPTANTNARRAQQTFLIFLVAAGIAVSLVVFPPRTSHWAASTTLRVGALPSDQPSPFGVPNPKSTSLDGYRLVVLASQVVLRTFAGLVESPATVRRAADAVGISAAERSAATVLVSGTPGNLVLTITVTAPTAQTASKLAAAVRDGGARYLNALDNTYDVSASGGVVPAQSVTAWDLARINQLVLFWDLVIMLVVWRFRRRWHAAQR